MLFDVSPLDLLVLGIMIILLFGPDKLPEVIQKVTGFLRKVRAFSEAAKEDVRSELGPEFKDLELADLHPKTFVRKHLLDGDGLGIEEIRSALDPRAELAELADAVNGEPSESTQRAARTEPTGRTGSGASRAASPDQAPAHAYDPDAT
ncbi:sec-independent translocase [Streptomyces broussonetiae]|uniref:Preprotein translocase n=1 Tax=Streptomyces broussonetiae TaxID=2686304 RepID=A0A6I6N1H2_9ACTN|nr:sec-independent translocase [Streptomyces broussonetiae]QHA02016.1 preprotein translocase [Streptomyces broussonetiae]